MFQYSNSKLVKHDIKKVLEIILDVENYPEFLPWCTAAKIVSHTEEEMIADLIILFKAINVKYTSRVVVENNIHDKGVASVKSSMIKGPFKFLNSRWILEKVCSDKTHVSFEIEFLLQSALFKKLLESVFIRASAKVLESFVDYINEDFKKSSHQKNND